MTGNVESLEWIDYFTHPPGGFALDVTLVTEPPGGLSNSSYCPLIAVQASS